MRPKTFKRLLFEKTEKYPEFLKESGTNDCLLYVHSVYTST